MANLVTDNETKQAPEVTTDETGYSSLTKFHSTNQIINNNNNNNDDNNNNINMKQQPSMSSQQNNLVNLAALTIRIPSVTLIADNFAAYKIVIADGKQKWIVFRRYSSILKFHTDLVRFAPEALSVLRFPKKKWFGNRQPNYLEKRRSQLELYFRMLLNSNLPRSKALKERVFAFFSRSDPVIENSIIFTSIKREEGNED